MHSTSGHAQTNGLFGGKGVNVNINTNKLLGGLLRKTGIRAHLNSQIRAKDFTKHGHHPDSLPGTTRFELARNLMVDIPGTYPDGYAPSWPYVGDLKPMTFAAEQYIARYTVEPTQTFQVSLGEYHGKFSLAFNPFANCGCLGEVVIPDSFTVLSDRPQTFAVTNFRKFSNGVDLKSPCVGTNNDYTAGGFEGKLTLTADAASNITLDLVLENYSAAANMVPGAVSYRYSSGSVALKNQLTPAQAIATIGRERAEKAAQAQYAATMQRQLAAVLKKIQRKYPGADRSACLSFDNSHLGTQPVQYINSLTGQHTRTDLELTYTMSQRNQCGKPLTLVGIRQERDEKGGYRLTDVSTTIPADWELNETNSIWGAAFSSLLGLTSAIKIQKEYSIAAARVGQTQWIRVVVATKK